MWFIYTFSFNGIPFYVGVTSNPAKRFKEHYYFDCGLTYNYLRYNLVELNRCPQMILIACYDNKRDAYNAELFCILALAKAKFMLLNNTIHECWSFGDANNRPPRYPQYNKLPNNWFNDAYIIRQYAQ